MNDATDVEMPAAPTSEPQAGAVPPSDGIDAVKKITHEVDTDDMFASMT